MRDIEAGIAARRRQLVAAVQSMLGSHALEAAPTIPPAAPPPESTPAPAPAMVRPTPKPPPPLVGAPPPLAAITEIEPVQAPYSPPPGASRNARPVWTSDGEHTGRLVITEVAEDAPRVAPTLEIAVAPAPEVPQTRQLATPEPPARPESTLVLDTGQAAPAPIRRGYERTMVLSEAQLRGEAPVPSRGLALHDAITFVLPATLLPAEDDGEPTSEAVILDEHTPPGEERTQVLSGEELIELADDEL